MRNQELPWTQPEWLEEASAWVHGELERHGLRVSGPIEQPHLRPWATVLRVPTAAGAVYFKATVPILAHEVALTAALARWHTHYTVPVLAADLDRHWLLLADGGTTLREIIRADHDLRHWKTLLPLYAELQIELAARLPELLRFGTPDRRLHQLPLQYERLLDDTNALHLDQPGGLTAGEYQQLRGLSAYVTELCEQLASYHVPESLHHGDFHDANIFVRDGQFRFFDWGDSCVTHPFFSLRTVFVSMEMSLGLDEGSEPSDVLDAYLEPWTRFGSRVELHAAYKLARQLAAICSALTWHRVVSTLAPALQMEYAEPVPALLQEFLGLQLKAR
ncbi:MAG: phosphotransferase [Herpetosiphonaceae bacterium]|nr:phosphotransferase [Herpetosiphonaceae bacterium]